MTLSRTFAGLCFALAGSSVAAQESDPIARGDYLVNTSGCHDCHTPWIMGANGPEPDTTRALSGHPADETIEAPAVVPEGWTMAANLTSTAWSGPWGVSFTANLTPDPETGVLRDMSETQFIETIRNGRHMGQGRPLLPPMPWPAYRNMTDADLAAIYAYLQQVTPIRNPVPEPLSPAQ
ncbi:putative lipoprotein [Fulvimarina pelagi HTCC2506]|uniref:Putative lipoprotein n=2 Tax=Fulvimarina pelagi TaxID=217511 RepID=Q0FYJ0_9HYPH|nr:c-type cytochrome [Fulvimarina pelagi]EAU40005.1 putative lipoprotein [Fulvimarina pelagi HTCC2506]BAT31047.1 putative lipoprotein [Fulvimarina pelagi]